MPASENRPLTALVLAAGRRGVEDSVARLQNKTHKCFVEIDGAPMIDRVVDALIESRCFNRILISIEREELLRSTPKLAARFDAGEIGFVASRETLADSVLAAAQAIPDIAPLVITTGDNALHTPKFIREFVEKFRAGDAEISIAFTAQDTVMAEYPEIGLAYHRLKDGGWSACNVYGIRSATALKAADVFRGGGQFGKRHWRILKAFGVMPFILYKLRAATLDALLARIGRNLGISIELVDLDYAFGPIDVDNPAFFRISEEILKARRLARQTPLRRA